MPGQEEVESLASQVVLSGRAAVVLAAQYW
jgi:hypothetical protein